MSIIDLNRFFKLWINGSNPRLKDLSICLPTEIIPNCDVLLKGLKSTETKEGGANKSIIRNVRGISAEISVDYVDGEAAVVIFNLSK